VIERLTAAPAGVAGVEWHEEVSSTNTLAAEAAAGGAGELFVVGAERQSAGRGRHGRAWQAPSGTSLLCSVLTRPGAHEDTPGLLPIVAGVALAEAVEACCPEAPVALKWPNDLVAVYRPAGDSAAPEAPGTRPGATGGKLAGILVEAPAQASEAAVVGVGVNVDWRGVSRPPELAPATSIAELGSHAVDRWALLAALVESFAQRYRGRHDDRSTLLADYRRRSATVGRAVSVALAGGGARQGWAREITREGALVVVDRHGSTATVRSGEVTHLDQPPA
jgi:BirA family biotin operon repressor/biotin-[acetyl-CoA-carboxylase] ligase